MSPILDSETNSTVIYLAAMAEVTVEARIQLPQFGLPDVGDIGPVDKDLIQGHLAQGYAAIVTDTKAKKTAPEVVVEP